MREPAGRVLDYDAMLARVQSSRILSLVGGVTLTNCSALAAALRTLDLAGDAPILLVIDSLGGSAAGARILSTALLLCRSPTIGLATTRAMSAAFNVLQACRARLAVRSSQLATHYSFTEENLVIQQDSVHAAHDEFQLARRAAGREVWLGEAAVLAHRTGMALDAAQALLSRGERFTAARAKELSLVDGIVWNFCSH